MENNHDIDKKFNEASKMLEEPETFPAFEKVWRTVEERLDKKEDQKRIIPAWIPYGIAASLIIGLGAFYFLDKKENRAPEKPLIVNNRAGDQSKNTIQKIDSTVASEIRKETSVQKKPNQSIIAYDIPPVEMMQPPVVASLYNEIPHLVYNYPEVSNERTTNIEEVVMVGYGQQKKVQALTGSVTTVRSESIMQQNSVSNALQGRVAGVQIAQEGSRRQKSDQIATTFDNINRGYLNEGEISVRGMSTLNNTNNPLFIVNGEVVDRTYFSSLDPKKIKNVQILKGADATSLFGTQGANGLVVVKTKRLSKKEKMRMKQLQEENKQVQQDIPVVTNESYDTFVENPFELTKNQPLSTFSIDVDNASYSNVRRMINNGQTVDKNAVRIEEMVNYFTYDYPQPKNDQPFSINTEYNEAPWNPDHKLLKIGLQGKNVPTNQLPASNLVFLIDVSGSMNEQNKLPLLKSSFKVLLDQLRPQDKVGIVVYAGSAGMVLAPTSAKEKEKIIQALDHLQAGGSTAGGEGIELAYKLAQENFVKNGNNRIIIATDGDFNVGASSTSDMQTLIEEKRKSGVFLTCLGFGMGNYKDNMLETIADKGNGNYAYIDNLQEANKFLGKEFAGSMYAIAKDVKIQIEFNPKYVQSYRLIGYENRRLKNEDFANDTIDAGELGSGHTVTALYEVIPVQVKSEFLPKESDLKYSRSESSENFAGELATIKFRYKKPDGDSSREISQTVTNSNAKIYGASPDFKFASSVAWFGLVARDSHLIKKKDLSEIENLAKQGKSKDEEGYRSEFIRLVESYKTIQK
ncbi:von Willebrand factor type A domain-containing protein [Chryseobacterium soli]|uniref:vWA domain-containing protein n=1 Tax=Chryseobacterium soli TaxID=445961 RepID=UPI002952C6C8|nr:von Willebrand factor type A domain-containing protein [Chryseobacterium soli]MDV7698796.1 von Willebrand factor type A domain-containing protein [Chryseobacterium soli]